MAECLPDAYGQVILPSAVRYLPHGQKQVGIEALRHAALDACNTVLSVKFLLKRIRSIGFDFA
jgi:molecular chaperone HscA